MHFLIGPDIKTPHDSSHGDRAILLTERGEAALQEQRLELCREGVKPHSDAPLKGVGDLDRSLPCRPQCSGNVAGVGNTTHRSHHGQHIPLFHDAMSVAGW